MVSTGEAKSDYGAIQTTLSTSGDTRPAAGTDTKIAPSGASYHYARTIALNAATLKAINDGNAVIVVHGDDPTKLPAAAASEKSQLVPSLPLAATAPALCGALTAAQRSSGPNGSAATGGGSTVGREDTGLYALCAAGLVGAAGIGAAGLARRRSAHQDS